MDSVTQFLLGAGVASIGLGPKLGWRAILVGGVIATMPDLDSFIPYQSPIDKMTHHRGFSHSLIVQTVVSPVLSYAVYRFFRNAQLSYWRVLLTVWLCLITHSLLDSLTTYGTQIFWPLNLGPPAALPSVFIIDPFYTLLLLIGVIGFGAAARRRLSGAVRFAKIMVGLSCCYLAAGIAGHQLVKARAMALPELDGHRIHVQPTPFNILYWQVLAVSEDNVFSGFTSLLRSCPLINLKRQARLPQPLSLPLKVPDDAARLAWFTDGFYTYREEGARLLISDLRIGFSPVYPFTFQFAEKKKDGWQIVSSRRVPQQQRGMTYLKSIYRAARIAPPGCGV